MGTKIETRSAPRQAPRAGAGRKPIPHPFTPMAKRIAGHFAKDGRPLAAVHRFSLTEEGVSLETLRQRFRRQLTKMGKDEFGGTSFGMRIECVNEDDGDYELLFWDRAAGK